MGRAGSAWGHRSLWECYLLSRVTRRVQCKGNGCEGRAVSTVDVLYTEVSGGGGVSRLALKVAGFTCRHFSVATVLYQNSSPPVR